MEADRSEHIIMAKLLPSVELVLSGAMGGRKIPKIYE